MTAYKFIGTYTQFYPSEKDAQGKSLMAEPGMTVNFSGGPPDDGRWIPVEADKAPAVPEPVEAVAPPKPEPVVQLPEPAAVPEPEPAPAVPEPVSVPDVTPVVPEPAQAVSEPPVQAAPAAFPLAYVSPYARS